MIPIERMESKIYLIRGQKVMLDYDLAELYQVPTKRLNEQVKRNGSRFPTDFMFQLTDEEYYSLKKHFDAERLRSQFATSKRGGRRYFPYVFTEQGIAMLSTVLHSERAIQVNIAIMRIFVKLRRFLSTHKELADKFKELEGRVDKHDSDIRLIFEAIRKMLAVDEAPRKRIGFVVRDEGRGKRVEGLRD